MSAAISLPPFPSACDFWRLRKTPSFKSCSRKRWSCFSERGRLENERLWYYLFSVEKEPFILVFQLTSNTKVRSICLLVFDEGKKLFSQSRVKEVTNSPLYLPQVIF